MHAELASANPGRIPLTTQQLKSTLNNLEERDLIRRFQASPRMVYFSTTLTREQLRAAVLAKKAQSAKVKSWRQEDRALIAGASPSAKANSEPLITQPNGNRVAAATATTTATTKTSAWKEMPFKKCLLKQEQGSALSESGQQFQN